jgi:hypothetical protein
MAEVQQIEAAIRKNQPLSIDCVTSPKGGQVCFGNNAFHERHHEKSARRMKEDFPLFWINY